MLNAMNKHLVELDFPPAQTISKANDAVRRLIRSSLLDHISDEHYFGLGLLLLDPDDAYYPYFPSLPCFLGL